MHSLKILLYAVGLLSLCNCTRQNCSITALCEEDNNGNYILKWELYPEQDNASIEIYVSDNDSVFPSSPAMITDANNYIAVLAKGDSLGYRYFRLKVGQSVSDVITNRFFELNSVQNFRDAGGYRTTDNKMMRWGKIFRSGDFSGLTPEDESRLNKLKLKTLIDFRPNKAIRKSPDRLNLTNEFHLPITANAYDNVSKRIIEGKFLRGDAVIYTQDFYRDMVENYTQAYARMFDYMCDANNYPIVLHCYLGKDQSGIATYFILRALSVPAEVAEEDYMLSNMGINKDKIMSGADSLSESRQEALTMITKTDPAFLRYAMSGLRAKYGSIDNYMTTELKLTTDKRKKLQEILLYR